MLDSIRDFYTEAQTALQFDHENVLKCFGLSHGMLICPVMSKTWVQNFFKRRLFLYSGHQCASHIKYYPWLFKNRHTLKFSIGQVLVLGLGCGILCSAPLVSDIVVSDSIWY